MFFFAACENCDRDCLDDPHRSGNTPREIGVCHETDWPGRSEPFEGFFESAIDEVGVNLGRRNVAVAEGTLDDQQVAGGVVEVGGEGVTKAVGRKGLPDARLGQPVLEPVGHLTR